MKKATTLKKEIKVDTFFDKKITGHEGLSQPIVINVKNTTDSVKNFELFGAAWNLEDGRLDKQKIDGLFIESAYYRLNNNVTYKAILFESIANPKTIGRLYIYVISGNVPKVYKYASNWKITTTAANSNEASVIENIYIDPVQFRNEIWQTYRQFDIDGQTGLLSSLPPESEIQVSFYPLADINLTRALHGNPAPTVVKEYMK